MNSPLLSIVVIVYKMPRQAMNTLYSLSTAYQHGVTEREYEVIVLENASSACLNADEVQALKGNFRYTLRQESRPTPVYAINEGIEQATGSHICLMVDGARMLSPEVVASMLKVQHYNEYALAAVPGYHLGEQDQKYNLSTGYDEDTEAALLRSINWKQHGYRLFDISCFSGANAHGFFNPMLESNCISCHRDIMARIGGAHQGFQTPGGGSVNLDIFRNLAIQPESEMVILAGEGSFHQFHGGVTTAEAADLEEVFASHREEFKGIRGQYFSPVLKEPIIFGKIRHPALPFLQASSVNAQRRYKRFKNQQKKPWPDDIITSGERSLESKQ